MTKTFFSLKYINISVSENSSQKAIYVKCIGVMHIHFAHFEHM
jgi:hypothetical protein